MSTTTKQFVFPSIGDILEAYPNPAVLAGGWTVRFVQGVDVVAVGEHEVVAWQGTRGILERRMPGESDIETFFDECSDFERDLMSTFDDVEEDLSDPKRYRIRYRAATCEGN